MSVSRKKTFLIKKIPKNYLDIDHIDDTITLICLAAISLGFLKQTYCKQIFQHVTHPCKLVNFQFAGTGTYYFAICLTYNCRSSPNILDLEVLSLLSTTNFQLFCNFYPHLIVMTSTLLYTCDWVTFCFKKKNNNNEINK